MATRYKVLMIKTAYITVGEDPLYSELETAVRSIGADECEDLEEVVVLTEDGEKNVARFLIGGV
jgi:hypothetical protein